VGVLTILVSIECRNVSDVMVGVIVYDVSSKDMKVEQEQGGVVA